MPIAILIWENVDLGFGQKYALAFRLGEGAQYLDVRLMFRIEFLICECLCFGMAADQAVNYEKLYPRMTAD